MYKFLIILTLFMFLNVEAKVYTYQLIANGDIKALKQAFDDKQIDINTTCGKNTPMILWAVYEDQIEVIDFLLSKGADINYKDERGQSLLHLAAFDDNLTTIKYLESKGLDLDLKDTSGETLLNNAVFSGNLEITKYMFSKGIADINTTDSYGKSLFYTACKNAHLEVIKYFISQGVDVDKKLGSFSPVFILLESYSNIENVFATLKYLVSAGADISDSALLEVATKTGKLESLKYLLEKQNLQNDLKTIKKLLKISAKANRTIKITQYLMTKVTLSKDELDALFAISIENRKLKIAKYLISKGADVNANDTYNNPIIFSSVSNEKVFKFLIENDVDHTVFNSHGETILHNIVSLSSTDTFLSKGDPNKKFRMLLLKDYFSIDILDDNTNTLLHSACKTNNIAMINYFLDNNLSMSKTNKDGETPLHYAMKYSDEKTLIHIIEKYTHLFEKVMLHKVVKGEDKNFTRWAEYSPAFFTLISPLISQEKKAKLFHLTIVKKNYLASKTLVANGVEVNLQDENKNTILHHLSDTNNIELLDWFLSKNANKYLVNLQNETPLHMAVAENNLEFTKRLLEENIQLSKRYTNGRSIFHEAVKTQNLELLKLVIPYVEDMNMQNNDGNTALHLAARTSSLEILKYLVLEKSNLDIKNNFNITPSMLIKKREDLNKQELASFVNISTDAVETVIKPYVFFNHEVDTVTVMSDKSKFILSSKYRDSIYIWDVKSFREIKKLKLKENPRKLIAIPNSTLLALKSKGKIAIYDIESEDYIMTFNIDKLRDFEVSFKGDKIYALGEKDKLFHIDLKNKSMIADKNTVSYIPSSSKLGIGKDEQLVALRYKGIEVYNFKEEITTKYALKNDKNYKITKMYINEENDILILDQHTKYDVKPKNEKRDIYVKEDNTYVKLKTIQSADTLSTNIAFDKKNTILYVLDHNKSKLHTYSKKNHFQEESTDIPTELMRSNIMLINDQIIFAKNPQYGSLKVSLFDLKSQKIISSKETSSEDTGYHLFVKHFDYKRSKLNNQKLYQEYYYNYNAYDKPIESYTLIKNKDGSKLIKKKGHSIIKEGADGKVIYALDTEHKYYLQYQIDEKSNLMATWSETTTKGSVHSDNFITLIDTKKGNIKKKINVESLADFGFIDKYLYIQAYRKTLPKKGFSVLIPGAISLYDMNTGEYIKSVDIPNVNLKIDDISENLPYISFTEKINDQTFIHILDLETEKIIMKLETEAFPNSSFSKNNLFIYTNPFGKEVLFDLADKKELYVFEEIEERLYHSFFIGENIIGFLVDTGKFVLYDFNTKKKLVDIFTFKDSWIMITPESYFTGGGTFADKLTFLDGYQNIYDTHQLYDHFFRPDIVKLKLHGEDIRKFIQDNTLHNALKNPPPKLAFKSMDNKKTQTSGFTYNAVETNKEKVKLVFSVKEHNGGGVGLVRVYQEGKLIQTIGEGKVSKQSANIDSIIEQEKLNSTVKENQKTYIASLSKSIQGDISIEDTIAKVQPSSTINQSGTYELEIELKSGKNDISIEAFNTTNTVTSYRENITINANIPKQKPKLYAIVAGVNEFEAPSVNNLKYSQNDAQAIKEAAEKQMKTVFDNVEVVYLTGKEVTKENIFKAAQHIAQKAKLDDTVLFYISTHGRAARGKLYLVPYNNKSVKNWIDFEQTFQAVQSIKALNQIFVIDACESGKANDIVSSVYDSRASVLAKSSGVHMLLATTKGTSAFEHPDPNIKNGVFTHRILEAMNNKATDANKDQLISILELSKKLKEPANNADYQYPVIRNVGKDVDLERVVR